MSLTLQFKGWNPFKARKDDPALREWLDNIGVASEREFKRQLHTGKSGVKYSDLARRSSAPGEYPASQSGVLERTIRHETSRNEVVVGSNAPYSGYLADGTRKMAARKMSKDALEAGINAASGRMKHWVKWARGNP